MAGAREITNKLKIMNKPFIGRKITSIFILLIFIQCSLYAQIITQGSNCEKAPRSCLSEIINEADFIFEGTVIESDKYKDENGDYDLKIVLQIDKIFKGSQNEKNVTFIIGENDLHDFFLPDLSSDEKRQLQLRASPSKIGTSGIFIAKLSSTDRDLDGNVKFEQILSKINLNYKLDFDINKYNNKQLQNIFLSNLEDKNLKFSSVEDVYEFIMLHPHTIFIDISSKEFSKESYEQWLNRKNIPDQ